MLSRPWPSGREILAHCFGVTMELLRDGGKGAPVIPKLVDGLPAFLPMRIRGRIRGRRISYGIVERPLLHSRREGFTRFVVY